MLELGMNHAGEITRLARRVPAEVAVITNVGTSHIDASRQQKTLHAPKARLSLACAHLAGEPTFRLRRGTTPSSLQMSLLALLCCLQDGGRYGG